MITPDGKGILVYISQAVNDMIENGKLSKEDFIEEIRRQKKFRDEMRPVPAYERAAMSLRISDIMLEESMAQTDMKPTCRRGCSFCCYTEVDTTWDEADLLIASNEDKIDWDKLKSQVGGVAKLPYAERACVFLKDGECSVYDFRPMACRKYMVLNDPDRCNSEKYPRGDTKVLHSPSVEIFSAALKTIQDVEPMAEMLIKVKANREKNKK